MSTELKHRRTIQIEQQLASPLRPSLTTETKTLVIEEKNLQDKQQQTTEADAKLSTENAGWLIAALLSIYLSNIYQVLLTDERVYRYVSHYRKHSCLRKTSNASFFFLKNSAHNFTSIYWHQRARWLLLDNLAFVCEENRRQALERHESPAHTCSHGLLHNRIVVVSVFFQYNFYLFLSDFI
jgi:hypothetical protein